MSDTPSQCGPAPRCAGRGSGSHDGAMPVSITGEGIGPAGDATGARPAVA